MFDMKYFSQQLGFEKLAKHPDVSKLLHICIFFVIVLHSSFKFI